MYFRNKNKICVIEWENGKFIIYKRVNYLTVKYSYTAEETTVYVLSILY